MPLSDKELVAELGPKCAGCGWRRGWHAPRCPQYDDENRAPGIAEVNVRAPSS